MDLYCDTKSRILTDNITEGDDIQIVINTCPLALPSME